MKLRLQFGTVQAASSAVGTVLCLTLVLSFASIAPCAFAQKFRRIAQSEAPNRRPAPPPVRAPNAMRPGMNGSTAVNNGRNQNNLPPKAIDRLQDMTPERQEKFFQNNERFKSLPPGQQAQIRQRLQAWNKLTPTQQQEYRERQQVWEQMTPDQKREVQQTLLPRWQQMPPQRRQAIMQRLHQLRDMSEPDRQAKLNDPSFVSGLSPEDRETLGQLAHLHVGMAPD